MINPVHGLLRKVRRLRELDGTQVRVILHRHYLPKSLWIVSFPLRLVLALLVLAALTVIKPLIHVRFVRLHCYSLGGYSTPTEWYFCMLDAGKHPKRCWDIFYHYDRSDSNSALLNPVKAKDAVCNRQLEVMYRRQLRIFEPARTLDDLIRLIPRFGRLFALELDEGDPDRLFDTYPSHLTFTKEEKALGVKELERFGLRPDSKFVCFYARDGAWIFKARPRISSIFGDYVLNHERNSAIENYLPAAEKLVELGYDAIRVGKLVEKSIEASNPRIIDYSNGFHSDFMDVYLSAYCQFFLTQNSGIVGLPIIFRKPIAFVNVYPLGSLLWCTNSPNIFAPKLFYSAAKGRVLSIREQVELGLVAHNTFDKRFSKISQELGLQVLENTPEEIEEIAIEMHQRLNGEFESTPDDIALQTEFSAIVSRYKEELVLSHGREQALTIGAQFLRRHPEMLN